MGWWSSSPQSEARDTRLCPYDLFFYSRPIVVSTLMFPMRPDSPPRHPPFTSPFYFPEFPPAKTPEPPPARSRAILLSPSLAAPPAPIGSGGAHSVSGSELPLTYYLWLAPSNALMAAPYSALPRALAPGVSIPNCAVGSTWKKMYCEFRSILGWLQSQIPSLEFEIINIIKFHLWIDLIKGILAGVDSNRFQQGTLDSVPIWYLKFYIFSPC